MSLFQWPKDWERNRRLQLILKVIGIKKQYPSNFCSLRDPPPHIGNGHIATTVFHPYIFLEGLYTGDGPEPHRVAIPSTVNLRFDGSNGIWPVDHGRRYPDFSSQSSALRLHLIAGHFRVVVDTPTQCSVPDLVLPSVDARDLRDGSNRNTALKQ